LKAVLFFVLMAAGISAFSQTKKSVYYSVPMSGKTYDLTKVLGEAFEMLYRETESVIVVKYDTARHINVILNSCYDTLFAGEAYKIENLFFLQRKFDRDSYQLTALCLGKHSIRGLADMKQQIMIMETTINNGSYKELVKEVTKDEIRLKPVPELMPGIYNQILNQFQEAFFTRSFLPCSKDGNDYCN